MSDVEKSKKKSGPKDKHYVNKDRVFEVTYDKSVSNQRANSAKAR